MPITNLGNQLYRLKKADLHAAADTFVQAFEIDPYFRAIFDQLNPSVDLMTQYFRAVLKYSEFYGEIYANSRELNGLAAWLMNDYIQFKINDLFCCGILFDILNSTNGSASYPDNH